MSKNLGIFWLREDFRLIRNYALSYASNNHDLVSAIYIFKESEFKNKREAQRWWIYKSLKMFSIQLKKYNINLELVLSDNYEKILKEIIEKYKPSIYWNKIYEPKYLSFDKKLSIFLEKKNIEHKIFKGNILNEYQEVTKNDKTPFKVFTPFWKNAEPIFLDKGYLKNTLIKKKEKLFTVIKNQDKFEKILPSNKWYNKLENYWQPSEEEALKTCDRFIDNKVTDYGEARDIPGVEGTSKISPYLALGQIHIETIWDKCNKIKIKKNGYRKYINELGWREFSHSLINYFPEMLKGNLRKEFDKFPWVEDKKKLNAWKKGETGYPIVDAGMRELNETGWMHNRVRMIVASFLVKHLRIHWKEGEKHFRNFLLDFNEANNIAGWQWVSGCGADAAPYFRIFNPILQGEKFDKKGVYVKKWVPELNLISEEFIHKPWEMKDKIKDFELGKNYPVPIVNHKKAREAALDAFQRIKK
jgi:deoxyribodipyrimidine photo-lyase